MDVVWIDRNYHRLFAAARLPWAVGHYILVGVVLLAGVALLGLFPPGRALSMTAVLLLLVGAATMLFVAGATTQVRDAAMAARVERYAAHNPGAVGCAVVGRGHAPGLREALAESPFVTLV